MSGCYQCGLPEGTDQRLCETCYRRRFHRGLLVVDTVVTEPPQGMELTPQARRWVLGGSAFIYVSVLGLALLIQARQPTLTARDVQRDFVRSEVGYFPVEHDRRFGPMIAPR